jgi:hypothetical protein
VPLCRLGRLMAERELDLLERRRLRASSSKIGRRSCGASFHVSGRVYRATTSPLASADILSALPAPAGASVVHLPRAHAKPSEHQA